MSKKDNFNKAMFDMFGVGTDAGTEPAPEYEKVEEKTRGGLTDNAVAKETVVTAAVNAEAAPAVAAERTYIGRGTVIEGNIKAEGDVELLGELKGDIESDGKVTLHTSVTGNVRAKSLTFVGGELPGDIFTGGSFVLGRDSVVNGNIQANDVTCAGSINGNIDIKDTLMLEETAVINGDIKTGFLSMSRGAVVRGKVEMNVKD